MALERHKVRDVGSTFFVMLRGEIWTLKKPKTVSTKLKNVFRAPDLSGMLHMFRGEENQVRRVGVGFMWCQGQIGELVQFQREDRKEQSVQRRRDIAEEDVITCRREWAVHQSQPHGAASPALHLLWRKDRYQ